MKILASRPLRVAAVAVVLAAGLAGCSAHPGKAAVVSFKDTKGVTHTASLSDEDVSQACADFKSVASCQQVMAAMVDVPLMNYLTEKYKVKVTEKEINAVLEGFGVDPAKASQAAKDVAKSQALSSALGSVDEETASKLISEYQTLSQGMKTDVSTRYQWPGSWLKTANSASGTTEQGGESGQSGEQGSTQQGSEQGGESSTGQ